MRIEKSALLEADDMALHSALSSSEILRMETLVRGYIAEAQVDAVNHHFDFKRGQPCMSKIAEDDMERAMQLQTFLDVLADMRKRKHYHVELKN